MRVAHVTGGSIGLGHLTAAEAIRRGLARAGFHGAFRMFGPASDFASARLDYFTPVPITMEQLGDPFAAAESELAQQLDAYQPDLILGETHWAPLLYLLQRPGCQAWFLTRKVPDFWFTGTEDVPFRADLWDRIISFEPGFDHPAITHHLEPIVACNRDELQPTGSLRRRWDVPEDKRLVVVAQAGEPGEVDTMAPQVEPGAHVVRLDGRSADHPFPLAEWLSDADVIFAGAGYNAYWESKWLGWFERTRFTAFPRPIDDQAWRLRECADYWPGENGADRLAAWILRG
jgi:hypothetical protein